MYPQTMVSMTQYRDIILPALAAGRQCGLVGIKDGSEITHSFIVSWETDDELDAAIRECFAEYDGVCDNEEEFAEWVDGCVENAELLVEFID